MAKSLDPTFTRNVQLTLRPRLTVCPDAADIDLGATEHFVAVPLERDPQPVRSFATDTAALQALADYLIKCGCERWWWRQPATIGCRYPKSWRRAAWRCA